MFLCTIAFWYPWLNTLTTTEYICALLPCISSFSLNVLRAKELKPFFLVCYVRLFSLFLLALGVSFICYLLLHIWNSNFLLHWNAEVTLLSNKLFIEQVLIFIKWIMSCFFLRNGKHSQTDKGWIVHCKNRTRRFWWWPQICWVQCLQCGEWHRLLQT